MAASDALLSGKGGIDELGIASHTVDYRVETLEEAYFIGEGEFEGLHEKPGGRSWNRASNGDYIVSVTYEGLVLDTGLEYFEVITSKSEEPLESHPYLQQLKEKFGGYLDEEGKIKFPEFMPAGADLRQAFQQLGLRGPAPTGESTEANPMFGWDSYLVKGSIVEHRFTTTEFPQDLYDRDGDIIEEVPADYIQTPPETNWLIDVGNVREVVRIGGNSTGEIIFEANVHYLRSRKGGWPPMHYLIEDLT